MNKCPLCKVCYASNPHCGLRLFNSENECAICLEKKETMIALPCGHQFCQEDLKKIGLFPIKKIKPKKKSKKRQRPALPIQPPTQRRRLWTGQAARTNNRQRQISMNSVVRNVMQSSRSIFLPNTSVVDLTIGRSRPRPPPSQRAARVRRTRGPKRCGWCGHLGHTIRKCSEHRIHCNCATFKSARHKMLHNRKHTCTLCNKKGHQAVTCHQIISAV